MAVEFDLDAASNDNLKQSYRRQGSRIIPAGSDIYFDFAAFKQSPVGGERIVDSCFISNIRACPAEPPPNWPKNVYFSPIISGRCMTLADVGPVTAGKVAVAQKGRCGPPVTSTAWVDDFRNTETATTERSHFRDPDYSIKFSDAGMIVRRSDSNGGTDANVPYARIDSVNVVGSGSAKDVQLWSSTSAFIETDTGGSGQSYPSDNINLYFSDDASAKAAADFIEYHRCLARGR